MQRIHKHRMNTPGDNQKGGAIRRPCVRHICNSKSSREPSSIQICDRQHTSDRTYATPKQDAKSGQVPILTRCERRLIASRGCTG